MKKYILFIIILSLFLSCKLKEDKLNIYDESYKNYTSNELWKRYKTSKSKIDSLAMNKDYQAILEECKNTINASHFLQEEEIEIWQLNNFAYYSILLFEELSEYNYGKVYINRALEKGIRSPKQRNAYILIKNNFYLLEKAERYLMKAKKLEEKYQNDDRLKKINNNLKFISNVRGMIIKLGEK